MAAIPATTLSPLLFGRGKVRRKSEFSRGLVFVAVLYLAVAVVEFSIIVLAAPSIAELGSLFATVT